MHYAEPRYNQVTVLLKFRSELWTLSVNYVNKVNNMGVFKYRQEALWL